MAYYSAFTVTLIPGKRYAGIEHVKKLAHWFKEHYGLDAQVLGNLGGAVYRAHLVVRFDSLASMEQMTSQLGEDEEYLAWFQGSEGLIEWASATQSLYEVFA